MEVRNLITFLKIIETGSFSKAAEQLTYSQSTVTVQIQQLEEEIGVQLFDRIGKKIYVTEKGHELEAYAQQIIALTQQAAAIGGEEQELQGTLRLACLDSPFTAVLPDILREYHCAHPKVDIIVKTADNVFSRSACFPRMRSILPSLSMISEGQKFHQNHPERSALCLCGCPHSPSDEKARSHSGGNRGK